MGFTSPISVIGASSDANSDVGSDGRAGSFLVTAGSMGVGSSLEGPVSLISLIQSGSASSVNSKFSCDKAGASFSSTNSSDANNQAGTSSAWGVSGSGEIVSTGSIPVSSISEVSPKPLIH